MTHLEWRKMPQGWLAWNAATMSAIAGVGASYMRPWLYPFYTPAGRQTLQEFAFDHPFHNGLFIGIHPVECDGVIHNIWATPPQRAADDEFMNGLGRIELCGDPVLTSENGVLHAQFDHAWMGFNGVVIFNERRSYEIFVNERGHHVTMFAQLNAARDVRIPQTKFAGVGIRLDPRLTKTAGGRFVCHHGTGGAAVAHGKALDQLSAEAEGQNGFGLSIASSVHTGPWFVRDYGLVLLNPAAERAIELKAGERLLIDATLSAYDLVKSAI